MTICYNKLWKLLIDKNMKKEGSASGYRHVYDRPCQAGQEPACQYRDSDENLHRTGLRLLRYHRARKGGKP